MLKEKQLTLKQKLKIILKEINHIKEIKQELGKVFICRNLSAHRAMNVFMGNESLDTIGDSENDIRFLFLFCIALNYAVSNTIIDRKDEFEIDVKEYFTQVEYNQWINYQEESKSDKIYPIVFENVQLIADRIWQTTLTAQQLGELDTQNLLLYNFKTQRAPKITVSGVRIDFDKTKTLEIKERILNGEQFPDHIKLNILNNFQEKIHYDPKKQVLTIGEGSIINIFDGYHRKVANSLVIEENPNIDFNWGIIITNLSETAAKDYMVQIDKQKPIKREQIKSWDLNKKENLVVSVIADDKISKLAKVMKEQESEIKLEKGLVTKNIIADAIKENYELDDTTDIRALGNWIVEFTDYLFSLYFDELIKNPYELKENSYIGHKNMFYGYIALSAKLWNDDNWKDETKEIMESIDFNKENPLWRELSIETKIANKTLRNKLYNLFKRSE